MPELSKPAELDGAAATHAAEQIERAYLDAIGYGRDDIPEVPSDIDSFHYSTGMNYPSEASNGYEVPITARVSFSFDGAETTETTAVVDMVVEVATYSVTDRRIERVEGVGGLTGTAVCW